jgi:PAS domain S-box-containing protein
MCASCANTTRFEERYVVARDGVSAWEPAWICRLCGAETFVRDGDAAAPANRPQRRYVLAGAKSRIDELRELRRILSNIRRQAQAQRQSAIAMRGRSHSLLEPLVHSALVSVMATDDRARYIDANAAACAITGYSRDELVTMTVANLFTEHQDRFDRSWQRFLNRGHFVGACRLRQRSGHLISVECIASANVMPGIHVATLASRRMLQTIS